MNEALKLTGEFSIQLYDGQMKLKASVEKKNLIVTAGKNYLASWLDASTQASPFMGYIAIGDGVTAVTASDTALESELARVAATRSSSANVATRSATFGPGVGTGDISEMGLFSASSAGTMFCHQTFSPLTKQAIDTIVYTWNLALS